MKPMAICSWSGGKDSCLALYKAMQDGYRVSHLLNFFSRKTGRSCFHGIESKLFLAQAEAIGIPLIQKATTDDMQRYEEEFKEAVLELKQGGIEHMVFGDIYLLEQANWVKRVCGEIGITAVSPLWDRPPEAIFREFVGLGFEAIIISCKADCMGEGFIGRKLDLELMNELKSRNLCPCGENGEYHTLVTDGPIFRKRIEITEAEPILKDGFWKHYFLDIKKYTLMEKINV